MSPRIKKPTIRRGPLPKREVDRRRAGLGFSRHEDPDTVAAGLLIVERFLSWIRQQSCAVTGYRTGVRIAIEGKYDWIVRVEAAHLLTRGSFAPDFLNVLPLADNVHHDQQHNPTFFADRGFNEDDLLQKYSVDYLASHLDDCRWLALNCPDATIVRLANEVLG